MGLHHLGESERESKGGSQEKERESEKEKKTNTDRKTAKPIQGRGTRQEVKKGKEQNTK